METVNGRKACDGWGKKLAEEQKWTHLVLGTGKKFARRRYGSEINMQWDTKLSCHDCNAAKGQLHVTGCDSEECPKCGQQLFICNCDWKQKANQPKNQ